jgi:cytochrome c biogenesis protein CcdA
MIEASALTEVGLFSVWVLGLSVGLTTCTAACMPYLGTWAMGQGRGGASSMFDTGAFALGKILAYAVLGGLAGILGETLTKVLNGGLGHYLIGASAILAGLWMIWPRSRPQGCNRARQGERLHPFGMGFALSFTPCAPLAALLTACAASNDPAMGFLYGMIFGLGAALTPLFIVIPILGSFGRGLREQRPWLGRWLLILGGLVLVSIGLHRILLAI